MNKFGMTDLQQKLYDMLEDELDLEIEKKCLAGDIRTMNASELRHNIKVFKETGGER